MLFESRRILLGFRIKIMFAPSLSRENSYVFVNISKTHDIKDLLDDIKHRFKIHENILMTLNDCPLLESEDILVLTDVGEVKIAKITSNNTDISSIHSQESETMYRDSVSLDNKTPPKKFIAPQKKQVPSKLTDTPKEDEPNSTERDVLKDTNRNQNLKRRYYSGSIAETIRMLNQNSNETDEKYPSSRDSLDGDVKKKNIEIEEQKVIENEINRDSRVFLGESGDELAEKRKRKRKRKHSKKMKLEPENVVELSFTPHTECEKLNEVPRQHLFFQDEDEKNEIEETTTFEKNSTQNHSSTADETILRNGISADKYTNKTTKHMEMEVENLNTSNIMNDDYFERLSIESKDYKEKLLGSRFHSTARTCSAKDQNTSNNSTIGLAKVKPENNFFNRFHFPSERKNSNASTVASENDSPLATLLMCKQLQTPIEYNLQFSHSNHETRSRSNSSSKISKENNWKSGNQNASVQIKQEVAEKVQEIDNLSSNDECEVLCQYKVVNDNIILRVSNGSWITLTADDASTKLPPLDVPQENQSITFQILYLSQDMCPKVSNLICGKVISFHKETGKLTLNILSSFIDSLLKDCGEDATLPEELVWIVDNAYEISWLAVKNPRLLM